jgi:uncharacterized membrane protein
MELAKTKEGAHPVLSHKWTFGQKAADYLTSKMGSWTFIIIFFIFLMFWIAINIFAWIKSWDPYPFILLNLVLSCLAAIQAPIILMSQNRENQKDRIRAQYDYKINRKAEREIEEIREQLDRIEEKLTKRD